MRLNATCERPEMHLEKGGSSNISELSGGELLLFDSKTA